MAGELEGVVREFMMALDSLDADRLASFVGDDPQGIDELSRQWMRGADEIERYLRGMIAAVSEVRTDLKDLEERVWGDVGLVTCWLDQDYTLEGARQHVSAPTSIVLRREDGVWKIALVHSIPLSEQS